MSLVIHSTTDADAYSCRRFFALQDILIRTFGVQLPGLTRIAG